MDQPEIQHETDEIIEKVNKVGFLDLPDDVSPTETYQKLRKSVSALQDVVTHQNNILIRMRRVCIDEYEDIQRLNSMIIGMCSLRVYCILYCLILIFVSFLLQII